MMKAVIGLTLCICLITLVACIIKNIGVNKEHKSLVRYEIFIKEVESGDRLDGSRGDDLDDLDRIVYPLDNEGDLDVTYTGKEPIRPVSY